MSAQNKRYAFLQVSDPSGVSEFTLFSKLLESSESILTDNAPIYIKAEAQAEGGRIKLLAQEILPLETAVNDKIRALMVHVLEASALEGIAAGLKRAEDGRQTLLLKLHAQAHEVVLVLPGQYRLNNDMAQYIKSLAGVASVREIFF